MDSVLEHERLGKAAPGQVAEHRCGEPARIELSCAIEDIRGRSLLMLRPRQLMFRRKRPQGGRMIRVIEQGLYEIEHVTPATAAPAAKPLGVIPA